MVTFAGSYSTVALSVFRFTSYLITPGTCFSLAATAAWQNSQAMRRFLRTTFFWPACGAGTLELDETISTRRPSVCDAPLIQRNPTINTPITITRLIDLL